MCGIFGVVATPAAGLSRAALESTINRLFVLSESRGKEASGIAVLSGDSIRVLKRATPATELLKTSEYRGLFRAESSGRNGSSRLDGGPIAIIGHSRLVTNGSQALHGNNQPVIAGEMVGVHNGIIANVDAVWAKFPDLRRHSQVDTEALLALIRHFYRQCGVLTTAVQRAFAEVEGVVNVAVFLEDFDQLLLATNNGSLYLSIDDGTSAVFASEEYILKQLAADAPRRGVLSGRVEHIAPGEGILIDLATATPRRFSLRLPGDGADQQRNGVSRRILEVAAPAKEASPRRPPDSTRAPSWVMETFERNAARVERLRRCKKCVLPETVPFVDLDAEGLCAYCRNFKPLQFLGPEALARVVEPHRRGGGKADCLVALSGGRDSCNSLHYLKRVLGLQPIAYTYDWGMVTDLARRNASRMCAKLGVEHIIISADITKKREYIRKNVEAWLKTPDLGTVPLFMAGDKQFFWYAEQLKKRTGIELMIFAMNPLERTDFKHGFCGISGGGHKGHFFRLDWMKNAQIALYYGKAYLKNPDYINASLADTLFAYFSYFLMPHDYTLFHDYIEWDENEVERLLLAEYNWERSPDTKTTWRIGDGTASFYNYIYYTVAGFTENDTFRSNQIREGKMGRAEALERVNDENRPRWESIAWYCQTIGVDVERCLQTIHGIPKLYAGK